MLLCNPVICWSFRSLLTRRAPPQQEHVIDSDGFFRLETLPKKVAVIGAGYIAVELAGVMNGLGSDTSLFVRKHCALREFDDMLSSYLDVCMKKSGECWLMTASAAAEQSRGSVCAKT